MTTLLDTITSGDRVLVTIKDLGSGDTEAITATVLIVSASLRSVWVKPDNTLLGLVDNLLIKGDELVAIERIP